MPEPDTSPETHYQRLGLKPTASPQQIRRAYRDLSKLYHPDTTELPPEVATEKFQQLNAAYGILSSPERRWAYDQQIGYSRISVIRPPADLNTPVSVKRREYRSNAYLDPSDRPLSAGEIFALFILGLTFVACLALVVTIGITQGETALAPIEPTFAANPSAVEERLSSTGPVTPLAQDRVPVPKAPELGSEPPPRLPLPAESPLSLDPSQSP